MLKSEYILEGDLSACFNNIDKRSLLESLRSKCDMPDLIIKFLYHYIRKFETRIER